MVKDDVGRAVLRHALDRISRLEGIVAREHSKYGQKCECPVCRQVKYDRGREDKDDIL